MVTYGPAAFIEGGGGPRIIPRSDIGLFRPGGVPLDARFEISDQRMSQGLLAGSRLFRLPSNAELGLTDADEVYRTRAFPTWALCVNYPGHGGAFGILYQGSRCPVCGNHGRRRQEAVRFVIACPAGHLDDVNWNHIVHRGGGCSGTNYFRWHGGGGSLSRVEIECPQCQRRVNLGWAYGEQWPCSGRFPEREPLDSPPVRSQCSTPARIIQRQASNLRIPELRTLFTVSRYSRLHALLTLPLIYGGLTTLARLNALTLDNLRHHLEDLVSQRQLQASVAQEILLHGWPEIERASHEVLAPVPATFRDLLLEEFEALLDASLHGCPPVHGPAPSSPVVFEVIRNAVQRFAGPHGKVFRVAPISRLRTVTVQTGYRREIRATDSTGQAIPASVVPVSFAESGTGVTWYPGTEFLGEGVFVTLETDNSRQFPGGNHAAAEWRHEWDRARRAGTPSPYAAPLFRSASVDELHPAFVWWHSFSHVLIRAISVDSGYSAASIRERVYVHLDDRTGEARGGVILYATQPGSEGSLGGLIALLPQFDRILHRAAMMAEVCSRGPLCSENHFRPGAYGGASCYACLLLSETSCEHRNLWLDREVLLGDPP